MRTIKFRAWSRKNKEMIYFGSPEVLYDESEGLLFYRQNMALSVEMKRPTLMQYTGLKDKNGKEIYEGDVVDDGTGFKGQIGWMTLDDDTQSYHGWTCYYGSPDKGDCEGIYPAQCTVLGNIYENPELLS